LSLALKAYVRPVTHGQLRNPQHRPTYAKRAVYKAHFNPHQYTLRSLLIRTPGVQVDPGSISSFITQVRDDVVSEMIFTARQHSLLCRLQSAVLAIVNPSVYLSVRPSVRPSVCLSVTRWHCVKTTQATIMRYSL